LDQKENNKMRGSILTILK